MEATKHPAPLIIDDDVIDIDPFGQHDIVWLKGSDIREGMVMVDPDLLTPEAVVDHKIGRAQQGAVTFMFLDIATGRHSTSSLTANKTFPMAAK